MSDLLSQFTNNLASAGGQTHLVATIEDALTRIRELTDKAEAIWAPSHLPDVVKSGLNDVLKIGGSPGEVRDQLWGLTIARAAIAETGSSLLVEPSLDERTASLMTQSLIILCETGNILPSLDEVAPILREISSGGHSYATLVTGPSRTADIERQLTVGVQGPAVVHVLFVDEAIS